MVEKETKPTTKTALDKKDTKPVNAPISREKGSDEPFYTFTEFVENPGVLGATADIVSAALTEKDVKEATISKAKEIVTEFKERKVQ